MSSQPQTDSRRVWSASPTDATVVIYTGPETVLHKVLRDQGFSNSEQLGVFGLGGRALVKDPNSADGFEKTALFVEGMSFTGKTLMGDCLAACDPSKRRVHDAYGMDARQHAQAIVLGRYSGIIVRQDVRQPRKAWKLSDVWDGDSITPFVVANGGSRYPERTYAAAYGPRFLRLTFDRVVAPVDPGLSERIPLEREALARAFTDAYELLVENAAVRRAAFGLAGVQA